MPHTRETPDPKLREFAQRAAIAYADMATRWVGVHGVNLDRTYAGMFSIQLHSGQQLLVEVSPIFDDSGETDRDGRVADIRL